MNAWRALLPLFAVLVLGALFSGDGAFFAWETHRAVLREVSVMGMLACGMTVVILAGGIDLAVGSVLALSAVGISWFALRHGVSAWVALPAVLALGAAAGSATGLLVARARIPAFIASLAMMVFARGLAKHWSGGQKISTYVQAPEGFKNVPLPSIFEALDARVLGGQVAVVTLLFAASALVVYVILEHLRFGRYVYAVGGNYEAARLAGVPVKSVLVFSYALCGVLAALAGICQAAQETQGDPETGAGYELDAIAMVVLGGTSLSGGRGRIGLTLIGALTLGYLQKVLSLNAYSPEARLMLTGAILIAAVLFQRRAAR